MGLSRRFRLGLRPLVAATLALMGLAALTLSGGEYAIHGTNRPESIGKFASYGCIRMHNEDIADLFERVDVGTLVVVTR